MKKTRLLLALAGVIAFPVYAQGTISAKQTEVMNKLLATYAAKAKVEFKEEKGRGNASDKAFTIEDGRQPSYWHPLTLPTWCACVMAFRS